MIGWWHVLLCVPAESVRRVTGSSPSVAKCLEWASREAFKLWRERGWRERHETPQIIAMLAADDAVVARIVVRACQDGAECDGGCLL